MESFKKEIYRDVLKSIDYNNDKNLCTFIMSLQRMYLQMSEEDIKKIELFVNEELGFHSDKELEQMTLEQSQMLLDFIDWVSNI